MRRLVIPLLLLALAGCTKPAQNEVSLSADQAEVEPGGTITVTFKAPADWEPKAWVGIVPSSVPHGSEATNDQSDLAYQYLEKRTEGQLVFKAPGQPGSYDFRMNDSDGNGKEMASVTFKVKAPPAGDAQLALDRTEFAPGEKVTVRFKAGEGFAPNAWVGIVPSSVAHGSEATNDQNDLAYQYLEGRTEGELSFDAPGEVGSFDFRMHDTDADGREVASVTFAVVAEGRPVTK